MAWSVIVSNIVKSILLPGTFRGITAQQFFIVLKELLLLHYTSQDFHFSFSEQLVI